MTDNQIAARDAALAALPSEYDASEGSVFWNMISAMAMPCGDILDMIDAAMEQKDPANLEGDELDLFVSRYGLTRHPGAAATASLTVTLDDLTASVEIPGGTLFETESGLQYAADYDFPEVQNGGSITVTALENGAVFNVDANTITVVPIAIDGVASVINQTEATGGIDTESDGELFERWCVQVGYVQTGYNKAWYEAKALDIEPVGYAKCYASGETVGDSTVPANYVYVIVLDSGNEPLTEDALASVQNALDPGAGGVGAGIAPPTAHCQVVNGTTLDVTIGIDTLTIDGAYTAQDVKDSVLDLLQQMMGGLSPGDTIYYSQLISNAMAADGVVNVDGLTVNGGTSSIKMAYNQVPRLAEVTYGTVTAV